MTWFGVETSGQLYRLRLKWWHPGLWVSAFRLFREGGDGYVASAYWTLTLIWVLATW